MAAAGGGGTFLVRVRGKAGTWRIPGMTNNTSIADVKAAVFEAKAVPVEEQALAASMGGDALADGTTLGQLGARNGTMLFLTFSRELPTTTSVRKVAADGSITYMTTAELAAARGYKPGLPSMRDMQKQWNWMDFMDLQKSVEFTVKAQPAAHCSKATLDSNAAQDLTVFLQGVAYQTARVGYLYGRFTSDGGIKASALYEPPQDNSPSGWVEAPEDGAADAVARVAGLLGLQCVGMVLTCPPRPKELVFTGDELAAAALKQGGAGKASPFALLRVSATDKGQADFTAFQVTDQCMEMLAAGALEPAPPGDDGAGAGNMTCVPKFTVMMEAKAQSVLPTTVFLVNVPVASFESGLSAAFPKPSRLGRPVLKEELAAYLRNAKAKGMGLVRALADFNLLVYLAQEEYLAPVVPAIAAAILSGAEALDEGHALMVTSWAGVEW